MGLRIYHKILNVHFRSAKSGRDSDLTHVCAFSLPFLFVRLAIAAILLVAVIGKTWELASGPLQGGGFLHHRLFSLAVVELEVLLCLWAIFGFFPRQLHSALLFVFMVYFCVSLTYFISGLSSGMEERCGCFGAIPISTGGVAIMDFLVVFGLVQCRGRLDTRTRPTVRKFLLILLIWVVVSVPAVFSTCRIKEKILPGFGTEFIGFNGHRTVVVEPELQKGGEAALLQFIEPEEASRKISVGNWTLVLFRSNCPACEEHLSTYSASENERVAFIEVPPYDDAAAIPRGAVYGRLNKKITWVVETPCVFSIVNKGF